MNHKDTNSPDKAARIIIVGESGVGKTSLLFRFCQETFVSDVKATIGVAFQTKTIQVDRKPIKCEFWNLAGQERCNTITPTFYKGASGVIFTYDVSSRLSFQNLENWINQIQTHGGQDVCKILIGNKIDGNKTVSTEEGRNLAELNGMKFFEASAIQNVNVTEAFYEFAKEIKTRILDSGDANPNIRLTNTENGSNSQQSGCCS